jgi:hypothetical protein
MIFRRRKKQPNQKKKEKTAGKTGKTGETGEKGSRELSDQEEAAVKERLKELGYL